MRRATRYSALGAALSLLLVTGCSAEPEPPAPPATDSAQRQAQEAALEFYKATSLEKCDMRARQTDEDRAKCRTTERRSANRLKPYDPADYAEEPHAIETEQWRGDGWGIMLAATPENGVEQYFVYGMVPEGDDWKVAQWNEATNDEKNQVNAICNLLATEAGQC